MKPLEKRLTLLRKRGFCLQFFFGLELKHQLFPGSPACQPTVQILDLPAFTVMRDMSQFLKISLCLIPTHTCVHTHSDTHSLTLLGLFLWRTLTNTVGKRKLSQKLCKVNICFQPRWSKKTGFILLSNKTKYIFNNST